jgi:phage shock protein A
MGILVRLNRIIRGNLNALLDQAENAGVMSAQILREMEDGLLNAKRYAAAAIAGERRLIRDLEQQRIEASRWRARAREALAAGREDLACHALARKKEYDDLVASLEAQAASARQTSEHLKAALRTLEARLGGARRKQRSILSRHRTAQARQELLRLVGPGLAFGESSDLLWERLETQLQDLEDQLAAQDELQPPCRDVDSTLAELEAKQDLERELEALKQEQAGGAS